MKQLYKSVLLFLLRTQIFYSKSRGSGVVEGITSIDGLKQLLEEIRQKDATVLRYESIALKQAANNLFLQTRDMISLYNDRLQKEDRERILHWISTTDYRSYYLDIYNRVMPGTGEWLFEKEGFREWEHSLDSTLLWLRGDGKPSVECTKLWLSHN